MKLRELPEPTGYDDRHTEEQVRAIQLEAAQDTLEFVANWIAEQRTVVPAHGFEFTNAIRAIKVEQP